MTEKQPRKDAPTAAQIAKLEGFGITPPPTINAAGSLLEWISNGGNETNRRIQIINETQETYVDKRVKKKGLEGTVLYIYWLSPSQQAFLKKGKRRFTHPLSAMIEWDDGKNRQSNIGDLELID